jgi:hypothetical protein
MPSCGALRAEPPSEPGCTEATCRRPRTSPTRIRHRVGMMNARDAACCRSSWCTCRASPRFEPHERAAGIHAGRAPPRVVTVARTLQEPGTNRGDDRELSVGARLEAVHVEPGNRAGAGGDWVQARVKACRDHGVRTVATRPRGCICAKAGLLCNDSPDVGGGARRASGITAEASPLHQPKA